MAHPFDPGYRGAPFETLAADYPDETVYPPDQFRVEWGPIFHRGRLDGSARVLVIGQDPGQHEAFVRRILVGEAGRRVQGLLARLGVTRSYVAVNAFLYSVYGTVKAATSANWNAGLQLLAPAIHHRDEPRPLVLYGESWADGDRLPIPEADFPAGLPSWMREQDGWAVRGGTGVAKRRNLTITVPKAVLG